MQIINEFLVLIDSFIGSAPWFAYLLLGTGVFFTLYLRFPQIRFFRHAVRVVRGRYDQKGLPGDTSHFGALATALSGTVGTGNIAGVAYALHLGGPSALFWMLVTAAVGMTTKFVEVTLSHKYREQAHDGSMAGGPMYYMKNAEFRLFGRKISMKGIALLFACATVISSFGTGNLPQINSIASSMKSSMGVSEWVTGLVLAVLLALVIIGGIKRIAAVTTRLVPFMAVLYVVGALSVIFYNYENIIPSFASVFADAFTGSAAAGGFMGAVIAFSFQKGVGRGLFSNEAGQGSAPIAHAAARANEPLSEGMVAILEPFIDTIIICSLTGLTLLASGVWKDKHENTFQETDMVFLDRLYNPDNTEDTQAILRFLSNKGTIPLYSGELTVEEGRIQNDISVLHARSLAENIVITQADQPDPFSGRLAIVGGKLRSEKTYLFQGKSLLHSAPLTTEAFTRGFLGPYGRYIVTFGLLLFAFSTAISWSYYGDRAMIFLFGASSVRYYRFFYVSAFFIGSFTDTTIVWNFASLAIALMTIPNLIGILWLRKEMPTLIKQYGTFFKKHFSDRSHPKFE